MRKTLGTLLAICMLLGLVAPVFAGFTDAASNKHIDKASAFGWLKGYPDGTFKPNGNITRAEASAVIVRALGLEAAAAAAKGLASKFSDVPSTHWASGYVNVCTTRNLLKGYPDGTFKPEANVTQAEFITMLVRALNREFEAVGEWPIGHITVAAAEKIVGTGFASSALATRGMVAEWVSKASEVVHGELTSNGWVIPTINQKTFVRASGFRQDATEVEVGSVDTNDKILNGTIRLADNYVIAGGVALKDLTGHSVKLFRNDNNHVVLVEPTGQRTTKTGTLRLIGADHFYLYNDDTKYTMATGYTATRNNSAVDSIANLAVDDDVEFFRNAEGRVTAIKATVYTHTHRVVTGVTTSGTKSTWSLRTDRAMNFDNMDPVPFFFTDDTTVTLDGKDASLRDIEEGMVVSVRAVGTTAVHVAASSKKVSGTVTAKRSTVDIYGDPAYFITIDGVEYRLEANAYIKDIPIRPDTKNPSDPKTNPSTIRADNVYRLTNVNSKITAQLSIRNRIGYVTESTSSAQFGRVLSFNLQGGSSTAYDKWVVDIRGVATTYEVGRDGPDGTTGASLHAGYLALKPTESHSTLGPGRGITTDSYIEIVLDSNGRIGSGTKLAELTPATTTTGAVVAEVYRGDRLLKIGSDFYSVGDSAAVYVDNAFSSGLSGISKDHRIRYVLEKGSTIKVALLVASTYAKLDTTKLAATAGRGLRGLDYAVEPFALVEVFSDVNMKTLIGATTANKYGAFGRPASGPGSVEGALAATYAPMVLGGSGTTAYLRVTNSFGMTTTATVTIYP